VSTAESKKEGEEIATVRVRTERSHGGVRTERAGPSREPEEEKQEEERQGGDEREEEVQSDLRNLLMYLVPIYGRSIRPQRNQRSRRTRHSRNRRRSISRNRQTGIYISKQKYSLSIKIEDSLG
jgi:hypothetical protein